MLAFAAMFALYQVAEWLQTIGDPGNPLGPALMLAALLAAWPLGRWLGGRGFDAFGLGLQPGWLRLLAAGLLLATLAKTSALALAPLVGAGIATPSPLPVAPAALILAALMTFVPSVAEDILTRGFLLRSWQWSGPGFIVASALLYTLNHIWRFDWGVTEQVRLFCLGLAYGAAAWRWNSLWGAVALHWGWNLANAGVPMAFTLSGGGDDAARLLGAAVHLVLLALVLLLPRPARALLPQPGEGKA